MTEHEIKFISAKEFRKLGYLQEVNRLFFHPLGLALSVVVEENGEESLVGIWDYRDDPEGLRYDYANSKFSPPERVQEAREKRDSIKKEQESRNPIREKALGFIIEPIPE
jgi:hypothetical protein